MVIILLLLREGSLIATRSRGAEDGSIQVAFSTSKGVPDCTLLAPHVSSCKHRQLVAEAEATGCDQGIHQESKAESFDYLVPFCNPVRVKWPSAGLISSLTDDSGSRRVATGSHPSKTCPSSEAR